MPHMKRKAQRKRRILFLVLFLVCMGIGVGYHMMDSNKSINVVSKFQQQQKVKTDGGVGVGSTKYTDPTFEIKKKSLEDILKETNEQANKAINDLQEAINTTDDDNKIVLYTSEKEGGIGKLFTDWWWVLVGLYFFRGIFSSGS